MNYYLIQYGDDRNPIECVSSAELAQLEENAMEFDGFTGIHVITKLTKEEAIEWQKEQKK